MAADLSICIVNWNVRDLLRQCLQSIYQHADGLNLEVIVVDNASHDGSADMVAQEFPQVILQRNATNDGFARGNNQAAKLSTGDYLFFLNNDTIVQPGALTQLVAFLRQHPDVGMVGPRLIGRDGQPQRSYRPLPTLAASLHRLTGLRWTGLFRRAYKHYRRSPYDAPEPVAVEALLGAAVCLPRQVFFDCGGWDEGYFFGVEDLDLSIRVAKKHTLMFCPQAEIIHLGRMSSRCNSGFTYTGVESGYARFLRKHVIGTLGGIGYKMLVTLNVPMALVVNLVQECWRRLRHGPAPAGWPHSELGAVWHFATRGLPIFWRA